MCLNAFKERSKVIVGIAEIIKFDNLFTFRRKISLILRAAIKEVTKLATVAKPATLLLCPSTEPYQLD